MTSPRAILKGALSSLRQVLAVESPLKMMKNAFYFTLQARFDFLVMWKNGFIINISLISKFVTSQPG